MSFLWYGMTYPYFCGKQRTQHMVLEWSAHTDLLLRYPNIHTLCHARTHASTHANILPWASFSLILLSPLPEGTIIPARMSAHVQPTRVTWYSSVLGHLVIYLVAGSSRADMSRMCTRLLPLPKYPRGCNYFIGNYTNGFNFLSDLERLCIPQWV